MWGLFRAPRPALLFQRHGIAISDTEIDSAIGCGEGAIHDIIERMKVYLTSADVEKMDA